MKTLKISKASTLRRAMLHGGEAMLCVLALSCGSSGRTGATPAPLAMEPCTVHDLASVDSTWHKVRAAGFTFCVPAHWRQRYPSGDSMKQRVWIAGADSMTWGIGRPPSESPDELEGTITGVVTTVDAEGGRIVTGYGSQLPSRLVAEPECTPPTRKPFMIGNVLFVVSRTSCQGMWRVTGWSTDPAIYILADSRSAERASLLATAMLTFRKSAPAR